ncbi:MAG: CHC2 zinc finger domain-containing protein, partial [Saprospiraceae bacterium]
MEITEIKTLLTLEQVLHYYHLKPDKNLRLCCPWHDDKTPSLQIYPSTNTWTCFSSKCKAGSGDATDMIMKMERCTKHEALIKATEMTGGASSKPKEEEITRSAVTEPSRSAILLKYYQGSLSSISHSV